MKRERFCFNNAGQILDENGMFEDIGGKIEESDATFKEAMKRS